MNLAFKKEMTNSQSENQFIYHKWNKNVTIVVILASEQLRPAKVIHRLSNGINPDEGPCAQREISYIVFVVSLHHLILLTGFESNIIHRRIKW